MAMYGYGDVDSKGLFTLFSQYTFPIILTRFLIHTVTLRNIIHLEKTMCLSRRYADLLRDSIFI